MIRTAVLKARAAHGYAWLQEKGPYYGFEVSRLWVHPEIIDVGDPDWCPLAHSDTHNPPPAGSDLDHFQAIYQRLEDGCQVPGTTKHIRVHDVDNFLHEHGFDIDDDATWRDGRRFFGTWGFAPGSERDWRILTQAWRDIVAANKPAMVGPKLEAER